MLIPKQVIVETSRACNLRCVGCPINSDVSAGSLMTMQFFTSIIDRINFKTTVIPWLGGEPLMHPQFSEMTHYITDLHLPMYITTNGHFWNEELFQHITNDTSCYQIIFSLDGLPGSKSIRGARPGSNPKKVVETIERFLALRREKNANIDVAVKIVERGQDWEEIEDYILYWLDRGISYVCQGRMLEQETEVSMRRAPCQYYDNNFMVIRHDGELILCAYNNRVANEKENPLFYLNETMPLLDAYNSWDYNFYRERQQKGIFDGPCATCGFAYTGLGMTGEITFRKKPGEKLFYSRDYYNSFYSLIDRKKPIAYYQQTATVLQAGDYYK